MPYSAQISACYARIQQLRAEIGVEREHIAQANDAKQENSGRQTAFYSLLDRESARASQVLEYQVGAARGLSNMLTAAISDNSTITAGDAFGHVSRTLDTAIGQCEDNIQDKEAEIQRLYAQIAHLQALQAQSQDD